MKRFKRKTAREVLDLTQFDDRDTGGIAPMADVWTATDEEVDDSEFARAIAAGRKGDAYFTKPVDLV